MKVGELSKLLEGLAQGLDGTAVAVAKDLRTIQSALLPFAERSLGDFVSFLALCEEFHRTGQVAAGKRAARIKQGDDTPVVPNAVAAIKALLAEIDKGTVTAVRIEELLQVYQRQLTMTQLNELLAGLQIAGKARSKEQAVEKIRQVLRTQTEMHVKTHTEAASVGPAEPANSAGPPTP